ncbi:MAG: hypothetical protein KGD59_04140 [Candidatus Heimdallarchaeota archaeon]|nr:hypothetical protein [Candidatus Heimdallarchaeota archaeon]MBY8993716.1 hypothetical protein [Candidatus Heimdallarchaeota archaeon]
MSDYTRLAEAQISIKSKDLTEIKKAKTILSDLIENYNVNIENAYEARYYLCKILLREYLETSSEEILEQLDILTEEILEFGNKGELIGFRIKANNIRLLVLLIREQSSTKETKIQNVEQLLMNVQRIAERVGLRTIARDFSEEQENLLQQKQTLEDFIKIYFAFDD